MALKAEVCVEAVTEGRRRFMAAWREEEEDAARHRQCSGGGGGGGAARLFLFLFLFSCSADHERDWPPRKVVFFRVGNQCAECEKQQQQQLLTQCNYSRGTCLNAMKRFCVCSL